MRAVVDTNVIVSALLWGGVPRQILDAARQRRFQLFSSPQLLGELQEVLNRPKFAHVINRTSVDPRDLVLGYAALASLVRPAQIPVVIAADPDDDAVLACAIASNCSLIVSGDSHLLNLAKYGSIEIVTPGQCLARMP
jgi:putative PIN family toxin of toxin-antitoxin system